MGLIATTLERMRPKALRVVKGPDLVIEGVVEALHQDGVVLFPAAYIRTESGNVEISEGPILMEWRGICVEVVDPHDLEWAKSV